MVFEKISQVNGRLGTIIRAKSIPSGWSFRVDFAHDTKELLYPVRIEQDMPPCITIVMDSKEHTSVAFPSVSGTMVGSVIKTLQNFDMVADAARDFISSMEKNL